MPSTELLDSIFFRLEVNRVSSCLLGITIIVSIGNYRGRKPETLSRDCVNRKQAGGRIAWHVTIVTPCVTRDGDAASRGLRRGHQDTRSHRHGDCSVNREVSEWTVVSGEPREKREWRDVKSSLSTSLVSWHRVLWSSRDLSEVRVDIIASKYCERVLFSCLFTAYTIILRLRWKGHYKKR